jgi:hypothetical protein
VAQHEYGGATKLKNIEINICTVFLKDCITLKTIVALCWLPCHFKNLTLVERWLTMCWKSYFILNKMAALISPASI